MNIGPTGICFLWPPQYLHQPLITGKIHIIMHVFVLNEIESEREREWEIKRETEEIRDGDDKSCAVQQKNEIDTETDTDIKNNKKLNPSLYSKSRGVSLLVFLLVILLLYSCVISFLYHQSQSALYECTGDRTGPGRILSSKVASDTELITINNNNNNNIPVSSNMNMHSNSNSNVEKVINHDWIQKNIIGMDNFPSSSVEFPYIFKHGFTNKMCRGSNKTMCDSKLFPHSKQADTLHGDRLVYAPYELGKRPISVDQICQVNE